MLNPKFLVFIVLLLTLTAAGLFHPRQENVLITPDCGMTVTGSTMNRTPTGGPDLCRGWPVNLQAPGAGFPYTPTLYDADSDGADEIFLTGGDTFGLKGDGSFLPGWPTQDHQYMGYGTNGCKPGPACADVDGDGDHEIFWTERDWYAGSSFMWCFNARNFDGSNLPNFPQLAPGAYSNALDTPCVLADTDGDGDLEAWGAHTLGNNFTHYRVSALDHLGNLLFTTDLNASENIISLYHGDLEGDGTEEIFSVSWLDPDFRLHAFDGNGNVKLGYPVTLFTMPSGGYNMFGPPVPVDLDEDGDLEILLGYNQSSTSRAACRHHDGTGMTGFPVVIASSSQLFYLGLGDLNGDGDPELLALENHLGGNYRAYAYDVATGTILPGWPFDVPNWPKGFPGVVDVDGNGLQDMCFVTDGGELYAVSSAGLLITGFPKTLSNASISGVAAGDIDGDKLFELVAATTDGWVYAWDTPSKVLPGRADWPLRGVNPRTSGVYGTAPLNLPLVSDTDEISESSGGTVNFLLDAGPANALRNYIILGSVTGTNPGTPLPGGYATLPLNWDVFTDILFLFLNTPGFTDFLGKLDSKGEASAQINAPPLPPGSTGAIFYFAFCLNNPFDFASNALEIVIVP